jgi:hypothetical protein
MSDLCDLEGRGDSVLFHKSLAMSDPLLDGRIGTMAVLQPRPRRVTVQAARTGGSALRSSLGSYRGTQDRQAACHIHSQAGCATPSRGDGVNGLHVLAALGPMPLSNHPWLLLSKRRFAKSFDGRTRTAALPANALPLAQRF